MPECKWCGEPFTPGTWPDHCCENCVVNDIENTWDKEERRKLQERFDQWLQAQEREMEEGLDAGIS